MAAPSCYRFAGFLVSRRRRQLLRDGEVLPLIPRYFDLLVLLIERRQSVVTRREIFDAVWGDVFVSDGALTQAIRTLRRTLGDDSREPVFIRTASRHGYSFIFPDVAEADEANGDSPLSNGDSPPVRDGLADLVARVLGRTPERVALEDRRDAAQQLHAAGTGLALELVTATANHAEALALLRDTRWDVPGAGHVPLWGQPEGLAAARLLVAWRTRDALRITGRRWVQAAGAAAWAGAAAGLLGGILLALAPSSRTPPTAIVVLMVLGAVAGFVGAAGVAPGIALAEAVARSRQSLAIVLGGALGGLAIGALLQTVVGWTLAAMFGVEQDVGGPLEGLLIGGAVAAGYAWTTSRPGGGIAAPSGPRRWRTAAVSAGAGALAGALLSLLGRPLVGGIIHALAQAFQGSQVSLAPLGAWIGEPAFGPITQFLVAATEGALFGGGLVWGLTNRSGRS